MKDEKVLKTCIVDIYEEHILYKHCVNQCVIGKEVYNSVLYLVRQEFIRIDKQYQEKIKENLEYKKNEKEDYVNLHELFKQIYKILSEKPREFEHDGKKLINYTHDVQKHVFQNIMRLVFQNFNSYIGLLKSYKKDKSKQKPKMPNYIRSKYHEIVYSDIDINLQYFFENTKEKTKKKLKESFLTKKELSQLSYKEKEDLRCAVEIMSYSFKENKRVVKCVKYVVLEKGIINPNQVRIIPCYNRFKIEAVYDPSRQSFEYIYDSKIAKKMINNNQTIKSLKQEIKQLGKTNKEKKEILTKKLNSEIKNINEKHLKPKTYDYSNTKDRAVEKVSNSNKFDISKTKNILSCDAGVANIFTMGVIDQESTNFKSSKITKKQYKHVEKYNKIKEHKQSELSKFLDNHYNDHVKEEFTKKEKELKKPLGEKEEETLTLNKKPKGWKQATLKSLLKHPKENGIFIKLQRELDEINDKINQRKIQFKHHCANAIIKYAIENNCGLILFGKNENMKQEMDGVPLWQQIPHSEIMDLVESKCKILNIQVEKVNEAYTSKSSFFDNEDLNDKATFSGERKGRWFIRKNGKKYDADVHACFNIYKKYCLLYKHLFDFNYFVKLRVTQSRSLNLFISSLKISSVLKS